jgi:hypothetical protein
MPFTYQLNTGLAPPLTGVAVNVAVDPWQIEYDGDTAMLTEVAAVFIIMELLVTVAEFTQGSLVVNSQLTTSPT